MTTQTKCTKKCHRLPGLIVSDHHFSVPLDYDRPKSGDIEIYARELVTPENEAKEDLPWLLFLAGGPGVQSPRPEAAAGWIKSALDEYRILLLDQRGTGLSSPLTHETLASISEAKLQAEYLKHFRADNIVRDCELVRKSITGGKPWTVLGQSYGGFCIVTYLSIAPEGLAGALITGGLPPLVEQLDQVYRATYKRVMDKNKLFYERFPDDVKSVRRIVDALLSERVTLPTGELLSARRFLQIGINLGFTSTGASLNAIHYLVESAFISVSSKPVLSYGFKRGVDNLVYYFQTNPLYALLQEAIYCQHQASNWSAERVLNEFPEFQLESEPVFFTGEMVYPWMFDEYECLKPLKEVAHILAEYPGWPKLYDLDVLKKNKVPCAALIYYNDMYVDRELSEQTAANIQGIKLWITNEHEHDGLRTNGEIVFGRLLAMLKGEI